MEIPRLECGNGSRKVEGKQQYITFCTWKTIMSLPKLPKAIYLLCYLPITLQEFISLSMQQTILCIP